MISATALRQLRRTSSTPRSADGQPLDQPHAGGAVDPFEVEPRAAAIAADVFGRLGLEAPVVEILEAAPRDAGGLELAVAAAPRACSTVEAPLADKRVHLPASVAAELLRVPLANEAGGHGRGRSARTPPRRSGGGPGEERVTAAPLPGWPAPPGPSVWPRERTGGPPDGHRCATPRPLARRCAPVSGSSRRHAAARRVRPTG